MNPALPEGMLDVDGHPYANEPYIPIQLNPTERAQIAATLANGLHAFLLHGHPDGSSFPMWAPLVINQLLTGNPGRVIGRETLLALTCTLGHISHLIDHHGLEACCGGPHQNEDSSTLTDNLAAAADYWYDLVVSRSGFGIVQN